MFSCFVGVSLCLSFICLTVLPFPFHTQTQTHTHTHSALAYSISLSVGVLPGTVCSLWVLSEASHLGGVWERKNTASDRFRALSAPQE